MVVAGSPRHHLDMQILRLLPVVLSTPVLAAHLFRGGWPFVLALAVALLPFALVGARRPAVRAVQLVLVVGAAEWLRTVATLVAARREAGQPHLRLTAILGVVAALTALAAWTLESWRRHRAIASTARTVTP
jgi:uncharacterized membrane protein HdeD (DUF308 family)